MNRTLIPRPAGDVAIVLSGGGARAAYQVGLLRCLAELAPEYRFPIVTGVSAGAINAVSKSSQITLPVRICCW